MPVEDKFKANSADSYSFTALKTRHNIRPDNKKIPGFRMSIIGGVVASLGAGICCAGPLVLLLLGISGSWIGSLTLLEPYRLIFMLLVFALFAVTGWRIYRPIEVCKPGSNCAIAQVRKRRQVIFWLAVLMALLLVTSNYWIIWLIE